MGKTAESNGSLFISCRCRLRMILVGIQGRVRRIQGYIAETGLVWRKCDLY